MPSYSFDWVNAFTTDRFGGNGCVVVHDAGEVPLDTRMALVRETSLSECAYLVPSGKADFGARYYLPHAEIPLAGHPTIATVASLVDRGLVGEGSFTLEVGAGVMPIDVTSDGTITMTQPAPRFGEEQDPQTIAGIYGLNASDIVGTPQIVSTGTPFCIAVLSSHEALRRAQIDAEALKAFQREADTDGGKLLEPFLVTLDGATPAGNTFARLILAPPMPPEDPFTGSATGCMAAYLWHHGMIERSSFVAEQGHWMGRPGAASVEVLGPRDAITGIRVGGKGVICMRGEVAL